MTTYAELVADIAEWDAEAEAMEIEDIHGHMDQERVRRELITRHGTDVLAILATVDFAPANISMRIDRDGFADTLRVFS